MFHYFISGYSCILWKDLVYLVYACLFYLSVIMTTLFESTIGKAICSQFGVVPQPPLSAEVSASPPEGSLEVFRPSAHVRINQWLAISGRRCGGTLGSEGW